MKLLLLHALGGVLLATPIAAQTATPPPAAAERDRALESAAAQAAAGHPAEAARLLREAADRFHSVRALLQLARLQTSRKNVAGALESLRQARAIAPNSEEVLSAYAEASLAAHADLPALSALDALTRICPTVAQYHYQKGAALMQAGDTAAAVESLKQAERLEPSDPLTLIALGTALNDRQLFAEAKPYLLRGLSLGPDSAEAAAALAAAEQGLGEVESAEAHARRALAKPSPPALANLVMGMVLMKQDRCAEARDALLKAAAADPASPATHQQLGLAYACLHDAASAQRHQELYRQKVKESDERVRRLRSRTGFSGDKTPP